MWIWVIIAFAVIGAIIGFLGSDKDSKGEDAVGGAMAGGCAGGYCLLQIAIGALGIFFIIWLFGLLFG